MKKTFYINGINIGNFGIFVSSDTYLNSPLIDYTAYQIPARNGSVIQNNNRLNNVIRQFDCYVPESQDVDDAMRSLKKVLYLNRGYLRIESDYDPDTYQYGYFSQELNVTPFKTKTATFSLFFSCMPEKYFKLNNDVVNRSGVPSLVDGFRFNGDPVVMELLAECKNDYNKSFYGWVLEGFFNDLSSSTTYSIDFTSQYTKNYAVVLRSYDTVGTYEYQLLTEVDNYNLTYEYTTPAFTKAHNDIGFLFPLDQNDFDISADSNGLQYAFTEYHWLEDSSPVFTNADAFGCSPRFIVAYNLSLNLNINDSTDAITLMTVNDVQYALDFGAIATQYGNENFFSSFVKDFTQPDESEGNVYIMIDFQNVEAYIVQGISYSDADWFANVEIVEDISSFLTASKPLEQNNSITFKEGYTYYNNNVWIGGAFESKIAVNMGWYEL